MHKLGVLAWSEDPKKNLADHFVRFLGTWRVRAPEGRQKGHHGRFVDRFFGHGGRSPSRIKNAPTHHPAFRPALADKGAIAAPVWRSPEITYITERGARHSYHYIRGCGGGARRPPGFWAFF